MVIKERQSQMQGCRLNIRNTVLKPVEKFNYLRFNNRKRADKIKRRIGLARNSFSKPEKILKDKNLNSKYGRECWNAT